MAHIDTDDHPSTFATSVYTLGSPDAMKQFHVGTTVALLPLASYTVGLTFGPVLAAPLSETHGRKAVYLISIPIFALFILGSGLANNFATLAICRFLAGVFGSPPLAVGAGSISDLWSPEHYAAAATLFITCTFLGPAFGLVTSLKPRSSQLTTLIDQWLAVSLQSTKAGGGPRGAFFLLR